MKMTVSPICRVATNPRRSAAVIPGHSAAVLKRVKRQTRRTLESVAMILLVSGCASTMPETVNIPIPVPCIDAMPPRPALYTDVELIKLVDTDFIIALGIDRQQRVKYIGELEAVLQECVK